MYFLRFIKRNSNLLQVAESFPLRIFTLLIADHFMFLPAAQIMYFPVPSFLNPSKRSTILGHALN